MKVKVADGYKRFRKTVLGNVVTKDKFVKVEDSDGGTVKRLVENGVLVAESVDEEEERVPEYSEELIEESEAVLVDDYMDRNASTVRDALEEDDLGDGFLKACLEYEKGNKDRKTVKRALKDELEG